jgi:hypothetical protein
MVIPIYKTGDKRNVRNFASIKFTRICPNYSSGRINVGREWNLCPSYAVCQLLFFFSFRSTDRLVRENVKKIDPIMKL